MLRVGLWRAGCSCGGYSLVMSWVGPACAWGSCGEEVGLVMALPRFLLWKQQQSACPLHPSSRSLPENPTPACLRVAGGSKRGGRGSSHHHQAAAAASAAASNAAQMGAAAAAAAVAAPVQQQQDQVAEQAQHYHQQVAPLSADPQQQQQAEADGSVVPDQVAAHHHYHHHAAAEAEAAAAAAAAAQQQVSQEVMMQQMSLQMDQELPMPGAWVTEPVGAGWGLWQACWAWQASGSRHGQAEGSLKAGLLSFAPQQRGSLRVAAFYCCSGVVSGRTSSL